MKYKATINIDRDKWNQVKAKCQSLETTVSAEVTAFFDAFLLDKPYPYESEEDWGKLPKSLRTLGDILLIRLKNEQVGKQLLIDKTIEGAECLTKNYQNSTSTDFRTDTIKGKNNGIGNIQQCSSLGIKESMRTDMPTDQARKKTTLNSLKKKKDLSITGISTPDSESILNEPLEDWAREIYTDTEVAGFEKLSRQSICRYRTKLRQPQDESFWERWEVSTLNPDKWWRTQ